MANTVNDVMNVIASPDYGIKNIAVTNQEILAILGGVHNSKNNIHAIVDDVKSLLQKLVDTTNNEKKSIEINEKSTKINRKNVQDILDETKSIRKAIDTLTKVLEKQGGSVTAGVVKLSDKASEKVAEAMAKDIEKQKKGGGISAIVDAFTKLKNISLKDLIFGNKKLKYISKIFKDAKEDLKIDEKELGAIIKLVNASPEMMKALSKITRRVNKIVKNETVKKMGDILVGENSILAISQILEKNQKTFKNANSTTKDIKELMSSIKKTMRRLFFASLWAKLASGGIKSIDVMIDKILPLAQKLKQNKKNVETATKVAKKITTLIGNLFITSIILTVSVVTAIPAIAGAFLLSFMVDRTISIVKKLSKNKKQIGKSISAALLLLTFSGIVAITSLLLGTIAITGIPAILGSIFMLGIISINIFAFKLLSKALKTIALGSISMILMSLSLMLFAHTVEKIANATKGVTFEQVGVIAAMITLLGGSVALLGIPAVAPFIMLGSISMLMMGLCLRPFADTLTVLAKATEKMTMKQVKLIASSMWILGGGVASMALLLIPIVLGSVAMNIMLRPLIKFVNVLKVISEMKEVPIKKVHQVLNGMTIVANYFKRQKIRKLLKAILVASIFNRILPPFISAAYALAALSKSKQAPINLVYQVLGGLGAIGSFFRWAYLPPWAISVARRYTWVLVPFRSAAEKLSQLKKLGGGAPMKLVHQVLNSLKIIGNFFANNKLSFKAIWNAIKYRIVMGPFNGVVKKLAKLKEMGTFPMKLVYQTLNALKAVGNFFTNNSVSFKAIWNAIKYRIVMGPFNGVVKKLAKLKEMGTLPMKLVYQTLNAIRAIANYYENNPISRKTLRASWRYSAMLWPFGYTIKQLTKLKEMGTLPMKLVKQALNAIGSIANFYMNGPRINFLDAWKLSFTSWIVTGIVKSFAKAVDALKTLKEIRNIPTESVIDVLTAISSIMYFYRHIKYADNIDEKSEYTKLIVGKFITMATEIQGKFSRVKEINLKAVMSIILACHYIINYYTYTKFIVKRIKVLSMNDCVRLFSIGTKYVSSIKFKKENLTNVILAINSMRRILRFLKRDTLGAFQRRRAHKNISLLTRVATAMAGLSSINPSNISSVGESLNSALSGIKTVDISQAQAITNMFNAFNGINNSENIINKFADSVKEFTSTCQELMAAMEQNTIAINNADTNNNNRKRSSFFDTIKDKVGNFIGDGSDNNNTSNDIKAEETGVRIANVDEIAKTIAEKINGTLSLDVPDTQVQLLINGTGGNEWTITRY